MEALSSALVLSPLTHGGTSLSDTITSGARHELSSGKYPEDLFAVQAITLDGRAVLSLSISEGSSVFAETVITVPQLGEFARSVVAALHQVHELEADRHYSWVRRWLNAGIEPNPVKAEDGS
jgi:hypothetical protein